MNARRSSWLLAGLALALVLWLADLGHGVAGADDAWFVRVVDRVGAGEALYEDVFFGVPPLSVWFALPFAELVGPELALAKALNAAVTAATALLAAWICGRLGAGRVGMLIAALACVAYTAMPSVTFYAPLASLFALGALALLVLWRERAPGDPAAARILFAAGIAVGLAAGAKHSTGGYAAIAALAALAFASDRERGDTAGRLRDGFVLAGAAALTFAAVMVPVLVSGGLSEFFTAAVDKRRLIEVGSISYLTTLDGLLDLAAPPWEEPRALATASVALVPPLAALALITLARVERGRAVLLGGFAFAAIATVYPRADPTHIANAVPACSVAIVVAAASWARARPAAALVLRRLAASTLAALALVGAAVLADHPVRALGEGYDVESAPPLGGVLLAPSDVASAEHVAAGLREADAGENRTLLVTPAASLFYLNSGLDSPTRFDYPLATDLRGGDEEELVARIESGQIERVCVNEAPGTIFEELMPRSLIEYVEGGMALQGDLGEPARLFGCTLYEGWAPGTRRATS